MIFNLCVFWCLYACPFHISFICTLIVFKVFTFAWVLYAFLSKQFDHVVYRKDRTKKIHKRLRHSKPGHGYLILQDGCTPPRKKKCNKQPHLLPSFTSSLSSCTSHTTEATTYIRIHTQGGGNQFCRWMGSLNEARGPGGSIKCIGVRALLLLQLSSGSIP